MIENRKKAKLEIAMVLMFDRVQIAVLICCIGAGFTSSVAAQDQIWQMEESLVELELLDPQDAPIRRYALTTRHAPVREVPIPNSQNLFCTLGQDHNVILNYYRDIDTWVFQVDATDSARLAAGGIATCLDLTQRAAPAP